jgi:hypothetical protein
LIQGFEAYDNGIFNSLKTCSLSGGPQYSKNNIFYNFTSSAVRPAGAAGFLPNGQFQLYPLNQFINSTFHNANEMWIQYSTEDGQYGWATLDVDGTTTGVKVYFTPNNK